MREKKIRKILIKPIFSLENKSLAGLLSPTVLENKQKIEESLKKYQNLNKREKLIFLSKISTKIINSSTTSKALARAQFVYAGKNEDLATTPFLLGLVSQKKFLEKINDIFSIEVFEETQLFEGKFGRLSQLCLRRGEEGWFVDISTYVHRNLINEAERESPNSINILVFVEEFSEEEFLPTKDLSGKMIG